MLQAILKCIEIYILFWYVNYMKILVLNGSPKKRSDTMVLTNSFLSGIKSVNRDDINIEIINVIEKNIKPCLGCFKCWENKNARCVIDDDQNEIIKKYIEADVIIFSTKVTKEIMGKAEQISRSRGSGWKLA